MNRKLLWFIIVLLGINVLLLGNLSNRRCDVEVEITDKPGHFPLSREGQWPREMEL